MEGWLSVIMGHVLMGGGRCRSDCRLMAAASLSVSPR